MYIISVMIFTFSIRDFGHPKFLKSQFGHPVMKILAKSLLVIETHSPQPILRNVMRLAHSQVVQGIAHTLIAVSTTAVVTRQDPKVISCVEDL